MTWTGAPAVGSWSLVTAWPGRRWDSGTRVPLRRHHLLPPSAMHVVPRHAQQAFSVALD